MTTDAAVTLDSASSKQTRTPRNLVVCLDGTDNRFCATNTNVVRLFQSLEQDPNKQVGYYDPGVGTIWEPGTLSKTSRKLQMLFGLAFGLGVTRNVGEAYRFLMERHQPGDRIFVFGFSRGALEARAVAGLIHRCGLLHPQLASLEPYAMQLFQTPGEFPVVREFKSTFSRDIDVDFLGLWDTVTSMGNVWSPVHWPFTTSNPSVRRVAHAIAIDERRAFFRQNRWTASRNQTVAEVWFAGVHSDVGGGYPASTGRLWTIPLQWMADQAADAGLYLDRGRLAKALAEGAERSAGTPDFATEQHNSLTVGWKPAELVPKPWMPRNPDGSFGRKRLLIPALKSGFSGRPRSVAAGEKVHRSAVERFVARPDYKPPTLRNAGLNSEIAGRFLASTDEFWIVPGRK